MKRITRKRVYNKFNGHCAYCGKKIKFKQMQVDHLFPKSRAHQQPDKDNDRFSNLMPSCQKCNIHKISYRLEEWRNKLSRQVSMLRKNAQFDRVLRFRQIKIKEKPIVFYFERED